MTRSDRMVRLVAPAAIVVLALLAELAPVCAADAVLSGTITRVVR